MAEAIALAASIIAMVQIADRIATVCKFFIEKVKDYPKDLRRCYVEVQTLKIVFEGLRFLDKSDDSDLTILRRLQGADGPIKCCEESLEKLDKFFLGFPATPNQRAEGKAEKLKECLNRLAWPLKASKATELLDDLSRHKSSITMALQEQIMTDVRGVRRQVDRIYVTLSNSERGKLGDWISGSSTLGNPSTIHNLSLQRYMKSTGDWVFRTPEWRQWIDGNIRSIWINGIPGAGKTILASHLLATVIRDCHKQERTICLYYYCYHAHNRDESTPFLRWVLSQLLRKLPLDKVPEDAWTAFKSNRSEPDAEECLHMLDEIITNFDRVYVGIDALDESQDRAKILSLLETLNTRFPSIQLLATSRQYEDIKRQMVKISQELSMSNPYVDADIQVYVKEKLKHHDRFRNAPIALRCKVEEALTTGAKGMFRWAECQLDLLRRLRDSDILEKIKCLPETVEKTYEAIFQSIAPWEQDVVRHALHWVSFHDFFWKQYGEVQLYSNVLLDSLTELGNPTVGGYSDAEPYHLDRLKNVCGCLVSFVKHIEDRPGQPAYKAEVSRIAHYTVREFLESDRAPIDMRINPDCYHEILGSMFQHAIRYEAGHECPELPDYPDFGSESRVHNPEQEEDYKSQFAYVKKFDSVMNRLPTNLREYCIATAFHSLFKDKVIVNANLAFRLLDPRRDVYKCFARALARKEDFSVGLVTQMCCNRYIKRFDSISENGSKIRVDAAILTSLLATGSFTLAESFLQGYNHDLEQLARESLSGETLHCHWHRCGNQFAGELVTVLCQTKRMNRRTLEFLQTHLPNLEYSKILPWYMIGHICDHPADPPGWEHFPDCAFSELIQAGAMVDPEGFRVTPLQIAVYTRDILAAKDLLDAGADVNNTGDPNGLEWTNEHSVLYPYNKLHGVRPLDILTRFKPRLQCRGVLTGNSEASEIMHKTKEIERLLLSAQERSNKRKRQC
ncbi:hypothetical protein V8F20_009414 [Naviculisporaceae sp. PSN 640]